MSWYTGLALRKFAIVTVNLGVSYNIETLTGMKFSNPKIFFSIKEYYASNPKHHINVTYTLNYPILKFNNSGDTSTIYSNFIWSGNKTNKLVVFITEGDYGI